MRAACLALLFGAAGAAGFGAGGLDAAGGEPQFVDARGGIVVSESPVASRIGRDVLADGGNAVDAAVATAFALAVSWPEAGNLGGGGFMMVLPGPGRRPVCVEYRETAPAAATPRMFSLEESRHSLKLVGVPGTVRGLALAHQKFGRLPWRRLVVPAAQLAEKGVVVDAPLAGSLNQVLAQREVRQQPLFAELRRVFGRPSDSQPGWHHWKVGDALRQPDLARTLAMLADQGPDAFYTGAIAKQIVEEMERHGGLVSAEDLRSYRANVREPVHCQFRGHDIWGPPPPSSGGVCLIEMLNMLAPYPLSKRPFADPGNLHRIAETMRRAYCDRARYLGDPDFVDIPDKLTDAEYARRLAAGIQERRATPSGELAEEIALAGESDSTTHFSVIDEDGMAVSNTYTLEASWGARMVVPGAGFVLNNEMGDFNWIPGRTDRAGNIGTAPNQIAPGKRMLSSQTPTLVTRDGAAVLITGSPGGRTIINTVLCIVLRVLEFHEPLPQAIAAPRLHHQWFPDTLRFEALQQPAFHHTFEQLRERGHRLSGGSRQGSAHSIIRLPDGRLQGVADFRRGGLAAARDPSWRARWEFSESAGVQLTQAANEQPQSAAWSDSLPAALVTGDGALRIAGQGERAVRSTPLPDSDDVWIVARLRGLHWLGESAAESLALRLIGEEAPSAPAGAPQWSLQRNGKSQLVARAGPPSAAAPAGPELLSAKAYLTRPHYLCLHAGGKDKMCRVFWWPEGGRPVSLPPAPVESWPRQPRLELRLQGDMSQPTEQIELDFIAVLSEPPRELQSSRSAAAP